MNNSQMIDLKAQIKASINALKKKDSISNETVVSDYLKRYEAAQSTLDTGTSEEIKKSLKKLEHCARGYLETSSDYDHDFIHEMKITEKLIDRVGYIQPSGVNVV